MRMGQQDGCSTAERVRVPPGSRCLRPKGALSSRNGGAGGTCWARSRLHGAHGHAQQPVGSGRLRSFRREGWAMEDASGKTEKKEKGVKGKGRGTPS